MADTANTSEKLRPLRDRIKTLQGSNPDAAVFHIVLGELSMREQDIAKAQEEFQKAISLQPTNSSAHLALANLYQIKNDKANAEKEFKAAADHSPWRSNAKLKYADFKVQNGAVEEGKAIINQMIKQAPDYMPAYTSLMNLAFNQRNYDECAALVEKVLTRDQMNFEALVTNGRLKFAKGDIDHAIEALEKAANIFERVPIIHHNLALAYLAKGDTAKAVLNLNQAISGEVAYAPSVMVLAEMSLSKGDYAAVNHCLEPIDPTHPELENPYLLLAQSYLMQRQFEEAAILYKRVIELFPNAPEGYYLLGATLCHGKEIL